MKKIVFIILHYLTLEDTTECVASIRKCCEEENYQIVIVDNASPNGSGKQLEELYRQDADVDLIKLNINSGFAKGNNEGIIYARQKYNPTYIAVLNNDVVLLQENTIECIEREYNKSKFAVLGPMIYTADGRCNDNPGESHPMDLEQIENMIVRCRRNLFLCKWRLRKVYMIWRYFADKITASNKTNIEHKNYLTQKYNVQLHGCFLCFSKEYFRCFSGFYPETFLFLEENILFYLTQKEQLTTVYLPEIKVFHKEDSSSNTAWKSNREKDINKAQYVLDSARCFKRLVMEDNKRMTLK